MKTTFRSSLVLAALLAASTAQQPAATPRTTAAEQAFRDGWWAESGQGDLAGALAKYLAAAGADGPANVRAKALLNAGSVQQRLGKADSAIATFRQLLKDHPAEAEAVEQARVHLRELTAVDLTQGYDEWYDRWLFSEAVQLQILDKIQALAGVLGSDAQEVRMKAIKEVLAFGKGAVPALRKTCESGNEQLADAAVDLLFQMRQVPPYAALCRNENWTYDSANWRLLLRSRAAEPLSPEPTAHERLVHAATSGASELADTVLGLAFTDGYNPVGAIGLALMLHDADARQRMRDAMGQRQVPLGTRTALQSALHECDPRPAFTAVEWLAIGEDPLVFDLRVVAIDMAARMIGAEDGALVDTLLERVASAPPSARAQFVDRLMSGLRNNASPLMVPWTAERLARLVQLGSQGSDSEAAAVFGVIRADKELRTMLATALLGDPAATHACFHPPAEAPQPNQTLNTMLDWSSMEEHQGELITTRWSASLRDVLAASWPKWDDEARGKSITIVIDVLGPFTGRKALHDFFTGVRKDAAPSLHGPIDALLIELKR